MKKFIYFLSVISLLLPALAFSLTIDSVGNFDVHKSKLAGMKVYVDTTGTGFGNANIWTYNSNTGFSGFIGAGWTIEFTGDYTGDTKFKWILSSTNANISKIKIDAYGDSITGAHNFFDIAFDSNGNEFTPGSNQGLWYPNDPWYNNNSQGITTSSGTVDSSSPPSHSLYIDQGSIAYSWLFTDPVSLTGQTAFGDLYTTLEIDFDSALANKNFAFGVDTDIAVPAPATLSLFGLGLLCMCCVIGKKRKTC